MFAEVAASGPGSVLIAGGGLWADALARVVTRGGGALLIGESREGSLATIASHRPNAIIAGPPMTDAELIDFCGAAVRSSSASTVIAAVNRADINLRRALAEVGVSRVCIVPSAASDLAVTMVNAARLTTRTHARVPFTVTGIVQTRAGLTSGKTRDLSEGGLCVDVAERVARGPARVEFTMPGEKKPILAIAQVVWTTGANADFRAGISFEHLAPEDLARVRSFIAQQPNASYAF